MQVIFILQKLYYHMCYKYIYPNYYKHCEVWKTKNYFEVCIMTVFIIHSLHAYISISSISNLYLYRSIFDHVDTYRHFTDSCLIQGTNDWFDAKLPSLSFCYSLINVPRYLGSIRNCARPTGNKRVSFLQLKCPQREILGAKRIRSEVSTNLCSCTVASWGLKSDPQ